MGAAWLEDSVMKQTILGKEKKRISCSAQKVYENQKEMKYCNPRVAQEAKTACLLVKM